MPDGTPIKPMTKSSGTVVATPRPGGLRLDRAARSLAARLVLVAGAFAALPAILYGEFSAAEAHKRQVLLGRLQTEGQLIAQGLALGLASVKSPSVVETRQVLDRLDPRGVNVRLLFRPAAASTQVLLVAAQPPQAAESVEAERATLASAGIIDAVPASCDGGGPLDLHYTTATGQDEVLTSVVPFKTRAGCWAVVTSHSSRDVAGSLLDRPYWKSPEVQIAAGVYALLMVLVLTVFGGLWLSLRGFGRRARAIAEGTGGKSSPAPFAKVNRVPELEWVAGEFDQMVRNLRATAEAFRFAAEDNAHAFKTPIATIAQAVEPLRRAIPETAPASRSLQVIEAAVERLDALVAASRRLDQVNADLVTPPREKVDLSRLVEIVAGSYTEALTERGVQIERRVTPACLVRGSAELLETVFENILENAISFSPPGGLITVTVARGDGIVALSVDDEGPGAPDEVIERMFERYVSHRPDTDPSGQPHFGIGLWIVQRNVAAIGGAVEARNRQPTGLRMTITLPAAG